MQSLTELVNMVKTRKTVNEMGKELNRDIVKEIKERGDNLSPEMRKMFNQERIKALGLKLIQGGKNEKSI